MNATDNRKINFWRTIWLSFKLPFSNGKSIFTILTRPCFIVTTIICASAYLPVMATALFPTTTALMPSKGIFGMIILGVGGYYTARVSIMWQKTIISGFKKEERNDLQLINKSYNYLMILCLISLPVFFCALAYSAVRSTLPQYALSGVQILLFVALYFTAWIFAQYGLALVGISVENNSMNISKSSQSSRRNVLRLTLGGLIVFYLPMSILILLGWLTLNYMPASDYETRVILIMIIVAVYFLAISISSEFLALAYKQLVLGEEI